MRFNIPKPGRTKSTHTSWFPETQHPDLPLSPAPPSSSKTPSPRPTPALNRSASVIERSYFSGAYAGDRRSSAVASNDYPAVAYNPDDVGQQLPPQPSGGLTRSQTVVRRDGGPSRGGFNFSPGHNTVSEVSPPAQWTPDFAQLPTPNEHEHELEHREGISEEEADMPMSSTVHQQQTHAPGKTSSDSGQNNALDRWSQRRLQRLNTEQGFREQRLGGGGVGGTAIQPPILSPAPSSDSGTVYNSASQQYPSADAQPHSSLHHPAQPHPAQSSGYQASRTGQLPQPNLGPAIQSETSNASRSSNYQQHDPTRAQQQQYSPDLAADYNSQPDPPRSSLAQSRTTSHHHSPQDDSSMSNNGGLASAKSQRSAAAAAANNRQSMHSGMMSREGSSMSAQGGQGVPSFNASVVPPASQGPPYKSGHQTQQAQQGDVGRGTPQPLPSGDDMTDEDVAQLLKEHKELREKYTKVKKYYFEKEDQVKQLQNSLAHQRLSQSRTSLDDSEYTTRFNRLDGLVAQLAFSIRKSWKSLPSWLLSSVNKDAITIGKQEMTAAGRAVISHWLVDEVFEKYFHPDLDPVLSAQMKGIQKNIRRFAPITQTAEEEEYLTSKTINWRLATLEGLQEALRSPQCPTNRQQLIDLLKDQLCSSLAAHLTEPTPSDLEGGVHMIIELVVSIAIHLPLESRDVVIEYFPPGLGIMPDHMKLESGIPSLTMSLTDDAGERASMKSAGSDLTDLTNESGGGGEHMSKKRSMLSAITGGNAGGKSKNASAAGKHASAAGSSSSLSRPESSHGKDEAPPRVRMAAGIGVQVRGRSVLVKAPVFST